MIRRRTLLTAAGGTLLGSALTPLATTGQDSAA